jgi:tetratricopeptide (TPR) repeat protein
MNKTQLIKSVTACLICLSIVFYLDNSFAQNAQLRQAGSFFYQGNADYKEAKYESAIDNYTKILNLGLASGNLYYNLGNSYFKKGELGKAVLNYERALAFMPNDSDLKSNYEYVLSLLNLSQQFFGNWLERAAGKLFLEVTVNFLTVLLAVIYLLIFFILISSLFFVTVRKNLKIILPILFFIFMISAVSLNSKITYLSKGAVVLNKEVEVKFEPAQAATTYFKLTEGSKVEVLDRSEEWLKVKRPDGKMGWVDKTKLEIIF